jgi:hypothetical protein
MVTARVIPADHHDAHLLNDVSERLAGIFLDVIDLRGRIGGLILVHFPRDINAGSEFHVHNVPKDGIFIQAQTGSALAVFPPLVTSW